VRHFCEVIRVRGTRRRQNVCPGRAGLNVVGRAFRGIAAFFLGAQLLFGLMPEFIFPAFGPAVALLDLIGAVEDLFFRRAFHQLVLLAGTTTARRGQGPVRTDTVQARPSLPPL
jgi:hypothetical protein